MALQEEKVAHPSPEALEVRQVNPCQAALEVQPAYPVLVGQEVLVASGVRDQGVLGVQAVVRGVVAALFHHRFLQSFEFLRMAWDITGTKLEAV